MHMTDVNEPWVVVYDEECPFCQRQITRIRRRDSLGRFEYVPRQTAGLVERFPALAEGDFDTGMRLIRPDGRIYVGADSVYHIARRLPVWRWFAWLYRIPGIRAVARSAYAWVAAHRKSLGRDCDDGACAVPVTPDTPGDRE